MLAEELLHCWSLDSELDKEVSEHMWGDTGWKTVAMKMSGKADLKEGVMARKWDAGNIPFIVRSQLLV